MYKRFPSKNIKAAAPIPFDGPIWNSYAPKYPEPRVRYPISDNGLQLLQESLGLKPSESQGLDKPVFIAIDLEYLSNLK